MPPMLLTQLLCLRGFPRLVCLIQRFTNRFLLKIVVSSKLVFYGSSTFRLTRLLKLYHSVSWKKSAWKKVPSPPGQVQVATLPLCEVALVAWIENSSCIKAFHWLSMHGNTKLTATPTFNNQVQLKFIRCVRIWAWSKWMQLIANQRNLLQAQAKQNHNWLATETAMCNMGCTNKQAYRSPLIH